jgi:hypothetical protein
MSRITPFTLRIFVADGDPDGLRLVERSNWIGKGLIFPRALLPKIKTRAEFSQTGVYFLFGPREDADGEIVYIGEGDPVRPRLESHFAKKDFWTRAVFFVAGAGQLNKAHVQFLECRLVQLAKEAKRLPLENGNEPTEPTLSEADRADMDVFLHNLLSMLPVLGIHAFEKSEQATPTSSKAEGPMSLTCRGKGVVATGYETTQGFVVNSGSEAVSLTDEMPSFSTHVRPVYKGRRDLLASGVLEVAGDKLRFTQDYVFSSPSLAAAVVLGRSSNGRIDWKDAQGKTLKELQERLASTPL